MDKHDTVVASEGVANVSCGFLYNHDHLHQIAHSAPIALELMRNPGGVNVRLLTTTKAQFDCLKHLLEQHELPTDNLVLLELPAPLRVAAAALDPLIPFSRVATLLANSKSFQGLGILVTPEKTSLLLRSLRGLKSLKFVHTRHGAGDRGVGFDRHSGEFDFVLMSGEKIRDRLSNAGLLKKDGFAMVGYPKFDLLPKVRPRRRLFDNDLPTVLYNPHCSPRLSSWYRFGLHVIEAFASDNRYNLIFAPHVMLFRKQIQISLSPFRINRPGTIPERYYRSSNVLIDLGSERSSDMTYTEAADCYVGDVSSQVYEFLRKPRPCLFLDAHQTKWSDDPNYRHWSCGRVLQGVNALIPAVDMAFAKQRDFEDVQRALFAYSIDLQDRPSCQRAAEAVVSFAHRAFPAMNGFDKQPEEDLSRSIPHQSLASLHTAIELSPGP